MSTKINYIKGLDRAIIVLVSLVSIFYFLETFDPLGALLGFILSIVCLCSLTRFVRWAIPWVKQGFLDEE